MEAIQLALHLRVERLLIDNKQAARVARQFDLVTQGTVGILLAAKRRGILSSVRESLDDLKLKIQFRIHPELYRRALQLLFMPTEQGVRACDRV